MEADVPELRRALYRGDRDAAVALVAAGADVNGFDAGADPNAVQEGGFVPLDEALITRNEPLAAVLRDRGAHVSGNPLP